MLADRAPQLVAARDRLEELSNNFDVRKLAARMEDKTGRLLYSVRMDGGR